MCFQRDVKKWLRMSWPLRESVGWTESCRWLYFCDPQLFITCRSMKRAWYQLLTRTMENAHAHFQHLSDHSVTCIYGFALTYIGSVCFISLSLWLSLALLHHMYSFLLPPSLSLDSISPDNEQMIQLSLAHCLNEGASVFPSTVCEWCLTGVILILLKRDCWCTMVSVHHEIERNHLELMNKP